MKSVYRKFGSELTPIFYPVRDDGEVDVCPVDAFAGQTFNVSEFGHIKSDVSALMEAQSVAEKDLIAQRLVEAQGENPDLSGLTDSDIFKYSTSRYYQTLQKFSNLLNHLLRLSISALSVLQRKLLIKLHKLLRLRRSRKLLRNFRKHRLKNQLKINPNDYELESFG